MIRSKTVADSSVKWKMIYMHARLTRRKESSALVMQAELRLRAGFIKNTRAKKIAKGLEIFLFFFSFLRLLFHFYSETR